MLNTKTIHNLPFDIFFCISKFVNINNLLNTSKALKTQQNELYKYNLNLFGTIMYHSGIILQNININNIYLKFKIYPIYDAISYNNHLYNNDYICNDHTKYRKIICFDDEDKTNITKSLIEISKQIINKIKKNIIPSKLYIPYCEIINNCDFAIGCQFYNNYFYEYKTSMEFKFNNYTIHFINYATENNGVLTTNVLEDSYFKLTIVQKFID